MTNPTAAEPESLDSLAEDVADLRATVHDLARQLETNTQVVENLRTSAAAGQARADSAGNGGKEKKEKPAAPPFILLLDEPEYSAELAELAGWIRNLLAPTYVREVSAAAPWCPAWYAHPEAVARLYALWTAWQQLTTPEAGGFTGPSEWHRDHLDPALAQLRHPQGPFSACMTHPNKPHHHIPMGLSTYIPVWHVGMTDAP